MTCDVPAKFMPISCELNACVFWVSGKDIAFSSVGKKAGVEGGFTVAVWMIMIISCFKMNTGSISKNQIKCSFYVIARCAVYFFY